MPTPECHGAELRRRELHGIRVAAVVMAPGLCLPAHAHGSAQLIFALDGECSESWSGGDLRMRPGSVIFRPPLVAHANRFGRHGARGVMISYAPPRLGALAAWRQPIELPRLLGTPLRQLVIELDGDDAGSAAALEGLALLLLASAGRLAERHPWPLLVGEALRYIELHHPEPISLRAVAAALGVHRGTLAGAFRRHLDRTVGEEIRDARLRRALDAIRGSARPLADIAAACGFFDQSHMGRLIRAATGQTPAQIRRRGATAS